jgi:hypothetical protein
MQRCWDRNATVPERVVTEMRWRSRQSTAPVALADFGRWG